MSTAHSHWMIPLAAWACFLASPRLAVAGRCVGADPCYACTSCGTCKHCKSGGSCGSCKSDGNRDRRKAPLEPEPICSANRNFAAARPTVAPMEPSPSPSFPGQSRLTPNVRTEARTAPRTQARFSARSAHPPFELRDWYDTDRNLIAHARMKWRAADRVRLESADGAPIDVVVRDLSEADVVWLEKAQRSPDLVYERGRSTTESE
jgi:hypothetical protein